MFAKFQAALRQQSTVLWVLYLLIALGIGYQTYYVWTHNPIHNIWSDPGRHWIQGGNSEASDPLSMTDPVLFQLYIGIITKLSLKIPALIAFYTTLLCVITPWIWYRFFRLLQPSKLAATLGWLLLTWLPSWTNIYAYFMQETLMLPLLGAALYASWRCKRKQNLGAFLAMVTLWALAGLTRGVCIPLAAVATTWLWVVQPDKVRKAIYSTLILVLILGPLTYRSYEIMNVFAPHGIGHMNAIYQKSGKKEVKIWYYREDGAKWLFGFQSPSLDNPILQPLSDWTSRRTGTVVIYIDIKDGIASWKSQSEKIKLTFSKYLWMTKENLVFLFFGPSWPDNNRNWLSGEISHQMRWIWAPLTLACLGWTIFAWRRNRKQALYVSIILTWFVVQGLAPIVVNEGRYRKPFEGLLIGQIIFLLGTRKMHERRATISNPASSVKYKQQAPTRQSHATELRLPIRPSSTVHFRRTRYRPRRYYKTYDRRRIYGK